MRYRNRAYTRDMDDQKITDFLSRVYGLTNHSYYSIDPSNWERMRVSGDQAENQPRIHLWEKGIGASKKIVGLAIYAEHHNKNSCLVYPSQDRNVEASICDWVEAEHSAVKKDVEKKIINCSVCEKNTSQKAILAKHGFSREKLDTVFRKRFLNGSTASQSELSNGYQIKDAQVVSSEFLTKRAQIENQVFGNSIMSEMLKKLQHSTLYLPELDLLITASDGSPAAFCTFWLDDIHNVGYVEPVGKDAKHRLRSLVKTLLREGFRRIQKLGADIVYLGNNAGNTAANHLYESLDMPVFDREYLWCKTA